MKSERNVSTIRFFCFFFWEKTFNGGTEISLCLEDGQNYYSDININFWVN